MKPCPDCPEHLGYSPAAYYLNKRIGPLMWDRHVELDAQYRKITQFLAGRERTGPLGHDEIDAHEATRKLGVLAGLPED